MRIMIPRSLFVLALPLKKHKFRCMFFCLNVGASGLASPSSVLTVFVRASAKSLMSKWCVCFTPGDLRRSENVYTNIKQDLEVGPFRTANSWEYVFTKTSDNKSMPSRSKTNWDLKPAWHCWAWNSFCRASLPQAWAQQLQFVQERNGGYRDTDTIGQCLSELRVLQKFLASFLDFLTWVHVSKLQTSNSFVIFDYFLPAKNLNLSELRWRLGTNRWCWLRGRNGALRYHGCRFWGGGWLSWLSWLRWLKWLSRLWT